MSDNTDISVSMSPFELGLYNAIGALAISLKASPGFNNDALRVIAQKFHDEMPNVITSANDKEAYQRPLRALIADQSQPILWLKENGIKI